MIPEFSVVIPLYNRANYIAKSVQSVLNQTYSSFELIVVDDASEDNSVEIVSEILDPRINVIQLPINLGNAAARNEGWKAARGNWIIYLDSDDWFENSYLEILEKEILSNEQISFFWSGVRFVDSSDQILKEEIWTPRKELPSTSFFDELRIGTNCGVAFRRDLLKKHGGFDESFRASVDREFFLRISQKEKGKGIQKVLVNCLIGDHLSVRKDYKSQQEAYSRFISRYKDQIEATESRRQWWYYKMMWLCLYCGNFGQAKKCLRSLGYPLKSTLIFFAFTLLPIRTAIRLHKKLAF